jgi:hypothetical protein
MSWAPEGNIKGPPGITAFTRQGVTPLVNGQSFVAVVFIAAMADNTWVFGGCQVLNIVDGAALSIVPTTITSKTAAGFTIQLSGAPDSGNYFLQWSVAGAPTGGAATTYGLTGPISGYSGIASGSFMVAIPVGTTLAAPVTVTPHDGGAGGAFTPASIMLTTAAPSGAFTYTPSSAGVKTISTTNNGALMDPTALSYTSILFAYTLTGPIAGDVAAASTNFTVALAAGVSVSGTVTITPHDAGTGTAGTFTPTTVALTNAAPSATFTYTPGSTGTKTISTTNSSTLVDPASLSYNATAPVHLLNTLISYWKLDETSGTRADSQGANPLTAVNPTGSATGKIGNGALFVPASSTVLDHMTNSDLEVTGSFTFSVWVKAASTPGVSYQVLTKFRTTPGDYYLYHHPTAGFQWGVTDPSTISANMGSAVTVGTWYHLVCWYDAGDTKAHMRINDTTSFASVTTALTQTVGHFRLGARDITGNEQYFDGVIDEVGFWKRLLTAAEITALYNTGAGLPFSSFTT